MALIHIPAPLQTRITELETALRAQASLWEDTVNAMSEWVSIIDADFRIVRSNRSVAALLGLSPAEVVGRTCYAVVHGADAPAANCPIPRMLRDRRRAHTEVHLADGRWLSVTVDPLLDRRGQLEGAVHVVRDVTGYKAAQAEREALITHLEASLQEVRTLKGLIPICANCRRIRDDNGAWSPLEEFVHNNFDADFSHGLCPECAKKEYATFGL